MSEEEHPYHRGDQVALKKDGSLHTVVHVYKDTGVLLMEDFLKCDPSEVTMKVKKRLDGFMSLAFNPPRFVAMEDMTPYLPPTIKQDKLF